MIEDYSTAVGIRRAPVRTDGLIGYARPGGTS
jgi:hypothetical protein